MEKTPGIWNLKDYIIHLGKWSLEKGIFLKIKFQNKILEEKIMKFNFSDLEFQNLFL